jgi:hypothetical protein
MSHVKFPCLSLLSLEVTLNPLKASQIHSFLAVLFAAPGDVSH